MTLATVRDPQPVHVRLLFAALGVWAAVLAANLAYHGFTESAFLWTIRYVVKQAFCFFALSYVASPLLALYPSRFSRWLAQHRASLGAAFAVSQLSAGVCVVTIWCNWPDIIRAISSPGQRVLGALVFVWIALMLATSFASLREKLSARLWSGIHRYGMMVIWLAYLLDYGRRMLEWSPLYGVFVFALLGILALRARVFTQRMLTLNRQPTQKEA